MIIDKKNNSYATFKICVCFECCFENRPYKQSEINRVKKVETFFIA